MINFKMDLEKFLIVLIIVNFLVLCFPLFQFPPPQNLYPDSANHYKMIELIQDDISNINYNPGYRKLFHLFSVFFAVFIPIGYSMALVTTIFVGLLIFFSFKLSFHLTKDKILSLFAALLVIGVTVVSDVGTPSSPVPQTMALSLGIILMYYFFKEDWKKAGIVFSLYALTHSSVLFFVGLMVLASVIELFKDNKLNKLLVFAKSSVFVVILGIFLTIFSLFNQISFSTISPGLMILGHISPLSFLDVTIPFGVILAPLIGIFYLKKDILKEVNYFVMGLWFVFPILFSQMYWFEIAFFPPQRTLIFLLFPLAFFTAKTITLIKNKKILAVISLIFLVFSFYGHFYFYEELPKNNFKKLVGKEELEVISFLKEKPLDEIVGTDVKNHYMVTLSHKNNISERNFWLILARNEVNTLLDAQNIKYLLFDKTDFSGYENINGTEKEFENSKYVLFKVKEDVEFRMTDNLDDFVFPLAVFWHFRQEKFKTNSIYFLKIYATDTKEESCVIVHDGLKFSDLCPEKVDFQLSGKKEVLTELMNSYQKDNFYKKAAYFIRKKELEVHPDEITFFEGGPYHITYLAHIYAYVGESKYSGRNVLIGKFFWGIGLNR
ncbi:hypothetical protein KKB11_07555 [Candidatus Micrarchaeota archaeon]|nr:hypothetical protein [Candidatus Micrarchaeota archaeon]